MRLKHLKRLVRIAVQCGVVCNVLKQEGNVLKQDRRRIVRSHGTSCYSNSNHNINEVEGEKCSDEITQAHP